MIFSAQVIPLDYEIAIPRGASFTYLVVAITLLNAICVGCFIQISVRRPLQNLARKTEELEDQHTDFKFDFMDLSDFQRISTAIDLLDKTKTDYKHHESYLRSILETMSECILVLDDEANIVEVNQSFVSTWGFTLDDVRGKPIQTIFHPRHRQRYEEEIARYKATGKAISPDVLEFLEATDLNGREFPITCIYSDFLFGSKRMFVVSVNDITDQEAHKAELLEAKEVAEQAAKAKATFLANMSHEIRTPMNGVMGLLDLVSDTDLNSQQRAMIKTAKTSAESLLNILNDILDVSKIEAGKIDLEKAEVDLASIVEDVVSLFNVSAVDKGLELSCYIDPRLDKLVIGDSTRLRQIASNIIGNAVKFTLNGEVCVRLQVVREEGNAIGIELSVRDTGIGMSEKSIDTLFDQFSQADTSTTRKFGGTGLGMAISRQLTELMDGNIKATSKLGEGTTFVVALEFALGKSNRIASIDNTQLPPARVIVVDDNQTNREIVHAYLQSWGVESVTARGAKEAMQIIEAAEKDPFDICLTDYLMPEVDGLSLAKQVNAYTRNKTKVVLLNSGSVESSLIEEAGVLHRLVKPIRHKELFDLIALCLGIEKETQIEETQSELSRPLTGKALLVEDNQVNQLVAKSLLEKMNLDVDIAEDGEKALAKLKSSSYNVVLMDCLMPVMDGYETTACWRKFEAEKELTRLPIIALTANAMSGDREKCLAAGMDDFLSKPIKLDDMRDKLAHWLENSEVLSS